MNSSTAPAFARAGSRVAWRLLAVAVLAAALAACGGPGSDAGAGSTAGTSQPERPASVPADYVVTPVGYFHPSCVIELQEREQLGATGDIAGEDGSARPIASCGHASFDRHGLHRVPSAPPPTVNGWEASASSTATGATGSLSATWTVPAAPSLAGNQTIYLFPGLEPASTGDVILQPVLAWNGFADRRWTVASWNCCKNGNALYSTPRNVSAGDVVTGTVVGSSCDARGVCSSWRVQASVPRRGISTSLTTTAYGEVLDWTFGGAVEAYAVDRCDQFPASGGVRFGSVRVLQPGRSAPVSPTWSFAKDVGASPSCMTTAGVTPDGAISFAWKTVAQ